MKGIPSQFAAIQRALRPFATPGTSVVRLTDAVMDAIERPPGTVLCACNLMWIPQEMAIRYMEQTEDGHGFDDCTAGRG